MNQYLAQTDLEVVDYIGTESGNSEFEVFGQTPVMSTDTTALRTNFSSACLETKA